MTSEEKRKEKGNILLDIHDKKDTLACLSSKLRRMSEYMSIMTQHSRSILDSVDDSYDPELKCNNLEWEKYYPNRSELSSVIDEIKKTKDEISKLNEMAQRMGLNR